MITNESEQEWADRVGNTVATIATTLLIGILCYVVLISLYSAITQTFMQRHTISRSDDATKDTSLIRCINLNH